MKLVVVSAALASACSGGHGAKPDGGACAPFSTTAPGAASEVQPVWAGESWAIARPQTYVRIDERGAITSTALPDLLGTSIAFDGVELGYFVPTPTPHVAMFTPGDVSTLHASPDLALRAENAPGSVAPDPTGAPRLQAYFDTDYLHDDEIVWTDGTVAYSGSGHVLTLERGGNGRAYQPVCYSPVSCGPDYMLPRVYTPAGSAQIENADLTHLDLVASPNVAIFRSGGGAWKVAGQTATLITTPPVAWNGSAFVTYDHGAVQLYDADFQPSATRPLAVSGTTLLGVGATADRALLVFQSAAGVDYEQICL